MSNHQGSREVTRAETSQSVLLWFGILAAPLAWTAQILIAPDLSEVLCYPGAKGSGQNLVYGMGIELFLVLLTAGLFAISLAGAGAAVACRRRLGRSHDRTPGGRASWMALAGILTSVLFALAIAIGFLPMLFLEPCAVTP
jgi:hypothetical protein